MEERRILNRRTTWHLINIKARTGQNIEHYVSAFQNLFSEDPLVALPIGKSGSLKSVEFSELLDENQQPNWIKINILSYVIIDPNAFYNRRSQQDLHLEWDTDVVANKKEAELYFIPSVHMLAVRKSSPISLKSTILYLSEALNRIEPNTFDVDVVVERDALDRILSAHAVCKLEADISFSNPGHTDGFYAAFDSKLRTMNPSRFHVTAEGSLDCPLQDEDDGMLQTVVNLSEQNGTVKATIQPTEGSKLEVIDSKDHPKVLTIPQIINGFCSTIYNELKTRYGNHHE